MKKLFFLTFICCLGAFAKPLVTTTILPTKYFVERIAGDSLEVVSLVEKGADPHTYEPKPNQMKSVEKSELHFAVGMEFDEIWLPRLKKQFQNLVVVNTDENIKKIPMIAHHHHSEHNSHDADYKQSNHENHNHASHEHGEHNHGDNNAEHKNHVANNHDNHGDQKHDYAEHSHDENHINHDHDANHGEHENHNHADHDNRAEHENHADHYDNGDHESHNHAHCNHGGVDPHIWLDPALVKKQATNITNALIKKYPQNSAKFKENLAKFTSELDKFDKETAQKLSNLKSNKFMVYHPSWGYFAARYGLVQIPVEVEGKEPKPRDLKELIKKAKDERIKVIFVAPQFSKKAANLIAKQTGAEVIEIDQLPENWLDEMQKTVDIFTKMLK